MFFALIFYLLYRDGDSLGKKDYPLFNSNGTLVRNAQVITSSEAIATTSE